MQGVAGIQHKYIHKVVGWREVVRCTKWFEKNYNNKMRTTTPKEQIKIIAYLIYIYCILLLYSIMVRDYWIRFYFSTHVVHTTGSLRGTYFNFRLL